MSRHESQPPASAGRDRTASLVLAVLVLAALPWITGPFERGSLARSARELWASGVASAFAIGFGLWVIVLLRRERAMARHHLADLEALTLTDALTGLGNRRGLERDLARAMLRSRRLNEPLALLYMDVDDLKLVNDRFGHAAGDETLRALANVIRHGSREGTDSGYRVGGDEFVLVLLADRAGACLLAQRITDGFQARSPFASTLSAGSVEWDGAQSAGELLSEADRLMYRNKHMGRRADARARDLGSA